MELILVGRCMFWPNLACKFVTMCDKVMINVIQIVVDMKYFKLKKASISTKILFALPLSLVLCLQIVSQFVTK